MVRSTRLQSTVSMPSTITGFRASPARASECSPLDAIRAEWDGPFVVKGVTKPEDGKRLVAAGVDALGPLADPPA